MIDTFIKDMTLLINQELKKWIPKGPSSLGDAANYLLHAPCKRLRPLLVLTTLAAFDKPCHIGLDIACAIESIHSYSLIHDDLPCMDNDSIRRGQKALHVKYPEWLAVLTGDFLLTKAFEILSESALYTPLQKIALIKALTKYSCDKGLLEGQMIDLFSAKKEIDPELLLLMYQKKTACLFMASFETAAILCNLPLEKTKKLIEVGRLMGIAFQIQNDISSQISDLKNKKSTSIAVFGIEEAKKQLEKHFLRSLELLDSLYLPKRHLQEILEKIFLQKVKSKYEKIF